MSRVSSKSSLSPSATSGSSAIDLGKDNGVNLGEKTQTSVSTGGIGVTREVANIGGMSVTGGVAVEVSPIRLDISGNVDYDDPTKNSVSIGAGAEVPGGLLGVSGGVTINTSTGAIEEVSIGGEVAAFGVNVSADSDGNIGFEFTFQIPFTPIEISLGFGSPKRTPLPSPLPPSSSSPNDGSFKSGEVPPFNPKCYYSVSILCLGPGTEFIDCIGYGSNESSQGFSFKSSRPAPGVYGSFGKRTKHPWRNYYVYQIDMFPDPPVGFVEIRQLGGSRPVVKGDLIKGAGPWYKDDAPKLGTNVTTYGAAYYSDYWTSYHNLNAEQATVFCATFMNQWPMRRWADYRIKIDQRCPGDPDWMVVAPTDLFLSLPSPPFPNPPPRKEKMDDCCRDVLKLLRQIRIYEQETMLLLGRPLASNGDLIPLPANAKYFGEEIERIKTPIKDIKKPEKEKIKFNNFYELQMYLLKQQINLDVGVDPQSFVAPSGKVQNPEYERDSEQSLENSNQPETDKLGNQRELELGKDIKINSLSQQQQYLFEALKRIEYLFPYGELSDAKFDKSLIIPGAVGEIKIHNLIHFQEFFAQYLNATLGDPKIPIKIEDNNALKEGKQEAIFRHFSIAQMIRELYKITLESGDDINAIMETGIRDFRTNLANRIQIVQIAEMAQALIEDTGMLESQEFIPLRFDGDPYAGKWKAGMGFEPDADLDSNEEKATEKLMRATLKNFETQVKVIRRDKRENADIRDLLIQIAEMFIRSTSIPATKEGIEKALAAAKFKTQVDMALTRSQVKRAAAASRSRTKKRKKT